jgi:hypothetical protein
MPNLICGAQPRHAADVRHLVFNQKVDMILNVSRALRCAAPPRRAPHACRGDALPPAQRLIAAGDRTLPRAPRTSARIASERVARPAALLLRCAAPAGQRPGVLGRGPARDQAHGRGAWRQAAPHAGGWRGGGACACARRASAGATVPTSALPAAGPAAHTGGGLRSCSPGGLPRGGQSRRRPRTPRAPIARAQPPCPPAAQARDFDPDSLRGTLPAAVQALAHALQRGERVYVHCTAGLGRSPAVCIAYMYWFRGMQLDRAYKHLTDIRCAALGARGAGRPAPGLLRWGWAARGRALRRHGRGGRATPSSAAVRPGAPLRRPSRRPSRRAAA